MHDITWLIGYMFAVQLTDFVCLYTLTFPLEDCSEFGNFVITLINYKHSLTLLLFSSCKFICIHFCDCVWVFFFIVKTNM